MLKKWMLENFKPIVGQIELDLGKISVLAGLNSSGKSSIIQSILVLSQTLGNQNSDKALIFNGNIVQLGTFLDVLNETFAKRQGDSISIGFSLSLSDIIQSIDQRRGTVRTNNRYYRAQTQRMEMIESSSVFKSAFTEKSPTSAIEATRVVLNESKLSIAFRTNSNAEDQRGKQDEVKQVLIRRISEKEQQDFLANVKKEFYRMIPYQDGANYVMKQNGTEQQLLTQLNHFLPSRWVSKYSITERSRTAFRLLVDSTLERYRETPELETIALRLPVIRERITNHKPSAEFIKKINAIALDKKVPAFSGESLTALLQWCKQAPLKTRAKSSFIDSIRERIISDIGPLIYGRSDELGLDSYTDSTIAAASEVCVNFFTTLVRYIGPLRADPQSPQRFAPSSEPDDVGFKGEFAAAVFEANKQQQITFWHPVDKSVQTASLETAVDGWMRFLGVAHHVSTRDAGFPGTAWRIHQVDNSTDRPLHAVGVGVSQVLPILVAGLLAPSGALLMIEQPELHLHERAQARLADFFYGLSMVGKQCLIETHSVCMMNQFRLYMVNEPESASDIQMYFAEQKLDGNTQFHKVKFSQYGSILNWPEGFFDETLKQDQEITSASIKRRSQSSTPKAQ